MPELEPIIRIGPLTELMLWLDLAFIAAVLPRMLRKEKVLDFRCAARPSVATPSAGGPEAEHRAA